MVFQIEEENKTVVEAIGSQNIESKPSIQGAQVLATASQQTIETAQTYEKELTKDDLVDELEGIYTKLTMEHSVVETNFQHVFKSDVVAEGIKQSPYQVVLPGHDDIGIRSDSYCFLNGKK